MSHHDRTEILRRTDLAGLLDGLTTRGGAGLRPRWRCPDPDHEDRNPSVSIRVSNGIGRWRCWSCGMGGTAVDALVVARRMTVGEALGHLARGALVDPVYSQDQEAQDVPVALHRSVVRYAQACHSVLKSRTGAPVLEWLTDDRALSPSVLRANLVGADPGPHLLRRRRGLPRAGLAAVLPSFSHKGAVTYAQARYLDPATPTKYGNPVRKLGSNPGLSWTRTPRLIDPRVLVACEGVIDGLTAATAGFSSVAILGATYPSTRLADEIAEGAGSRRVVIAFDGDEAGRVASERLVTLLDTRGVNGAVCSLPEGADLNSLVCEGQSLADIPGIWLEVRS